MIDAILLKIFYEIADLRPFLVIINNKFVFSSLFSSHLSLLNGKLMSHLLLIGMLSKMAQNWPKDNAENSIYLENIDKNEPKLDKNGNFKKFTRKKAIFLV